MEAMMKKLFDQKLGEFLNVEDGKYGFQPASGQIFLKNASIKEDVFDRLHLPFLIRGGYIEEMSLNFNVSMFSSSTASKVEIKNVFLVLGPHQSDWSWEGLLECKTRLVDLVMKVLELKPVSKKKKKAAGKGGWMADMKKRVMEDAIQKVMGMLEVHVSNVHFRYEDAVTQDYPFACGFKVGLGSIRSQQYGGKALRTTGEWKHSGEKHADPFFSHAIHTRRISVYMDLCQDPKNLFAQRPVSGDVVKERFSRLNRRETFSACVVDEILRLFPPEHKRRKYLDGPSFRERLDFHRYVVFPVSLSAHATVNKDCEDVRAQLAPLYDADVVVDPLEVAIDSDQVRCINRILTGIKDFRRKDLLFRTTPRQSIAKYLPAYSLTEAQEKERKELVRAWWLHAYEAVCILCRIPKQHLSKEALLHKLDVQNEYVRLAKEEMDAAAKAKADEKAGIPKPTGQTLPATLALRDMQVRLPYTDIFMWRLKARQERAEALNQVHEEESEADKEKSKEAPPKPGDLGKPNTLQGWCKFKAFQAFFLVVADQQWAQAVGSAKATPSSPSSGRKSFKAGASYVRQLVARAQVVDVHTAFVQRGRKKHRIARWLELGVSSVSVTNCNAKKQQHSARQILSITPFETHLEDQGHPEAKPVCLFCGLTLFQAFDHDLHPGDVVLAQMLKPAEGVHAHCQAMTDEERLEALDKLGFLKAHKDDLSKSMMFAFARCGAVRMLHYTPFSRRMMHFMMRGREGLITDLVRRPSPLALDRELLVKLQRKVELLTGKSAMLGIIEGVCDGVRGRIIDHYNSQHVLCKEVSLAPMRCKALRNGSPQTFHMQFHKVLADSGGPNQLLASDPFGVLPWKVAMLLLPKADFAMGLDASFEADRTATVSKPAPAPAKVGVGVPMGATDPATVVLAGCNFLKWGRTGRAKKRFVIFDETIDAIVWKNAEADKSAVGVLPLSKVQDICVGIHTPLMERVRSPKLKEDRVWSIVATERTVDLQAESTQQRDRWVQGLKARCKKQMQREEGGGEAPELPKHLSKKVKVYQEKFRSDLCALRSQYRKLQAFSALGQTLKMTDEGQADSGADANGSAEKP